MAEKNNEVIEEITEQETNQPIEDKVEEEVSKSKFDSADDDSVIKVDLSKPPVQESEEVKEEPVDEEKVDVVEETETKEEVVNEEIKEQPVLQEITEETEDEEIKEIEEKIEEAVVEAKETGKPLPENIQKLVDFMEETGGDLQDYVNLNKDVSKMDDSEVLDEYYRATKSHLTPEERNFLLEDNFGYDEDEDDPKDIRKKKIALKEQVAEARAHLDRQKSKYYEDIKAGSKLTTEQQKAIDFFNRYNKESEEQNKLNKQSKDIFLKKTNDFFNDKFKGFDFKVGEKKFRFNVKNVNEVKNTQSDINNFVSKFVDKDSSSITDAKGYHKSLFTAMNADAIANHFYEQGKADAIKERVAKDKNINTEPRKTHGEINVSGVKYRVLGDSADDYKFKIKRKK